MGKNKIPEHEDDDMYKISIRDINSIHDIYDLPISKALTIEIFSKKGSSKKEIENTLIRY
jgi:hypothetical protein